MAVGSIIDGGTRSTNGIYEQDDVAYAFVMRHGLIQKKKIYTSESTNRDW